MYILTYLINFEFFYRWGTDEYVEKNMLTLMDTTYIHREPLGVCLVMGAWNYPVQLTLMPVIGMSIQVDLFDGKVQTNVK